jgi:glutamate-1-semialdehyde 2,1-aminomutase
MTDRNQTLFDRAKQLIPGGVNSPVRAFKAVGGTPRFVQRAQGAHFWAANGQKYIDYIGSWGPMILGHGHPAVLEAVQKAALEGFSFGAPTEREVELAEEIVKFEGCYHGHADALLVKAGSGLATFGNPTSAGVPPEVVQHTLVLEYNNIEQLEAAFAEQGKEIACLMMEPICGNMNFVRASVPFMKRCRELCTEYGALLVLDEVMTGFRVALGGAQSVYAKEIPGFEPDMTVMGKVIGGGMPLAAFGAKRAVMEQLAPLGTVYQAGTLSGNPVATACGLATLAEISKPGFYDELGRKTRALISGLKEAAKAEGVAFCGDSEGGMMGFYLLDTLPSTYSQVMKTDGAKFNQLFHGLLDRGVYIAPALYEAGFVSAAHTDADIAETVAAAREIFKLLPK